MAIHKVCSRPLYFSALRLSLYPPPWPDPRKIERTKENKKERHTKSPIKRRLPMHTSSPLPFHSAPGAPTPIPHSRRLPQPASGPPSHIRGGGDDVPDHLAASRVGEEGQDLLPALSTPCLTAYLCPLGFLLAITVRAKREQVLSRLGPVRAPPALSGVSSSTPGICQYSSDRLSAGNAPSFAFPLAVCH